MTSQGFTVIKCGLCSSLIHCESWHERQCGLPLAYSLFFLLVFVSDSSLSLLSCFICATSHIPFTSFSLRSAPLCQDHSVHWFHAVIVSDTTYIMGLQPLVLCRELLAFLNISQLALELFSPVASIIGVPIYHSLVVLLPWQFEALCVMSGAPPHQQLYTASKTFWSAVHTASSSVFWNLGQLYYLLISVSQLP